MHEFYILCSASCSGFADVIKIWLILFRASRLFPVDGKSMALLKCCALGSSGREKWSFPRHLMSGQWAPITSLEISTYGCPTHLVACFDPLCEQLNFEWSTGNWESGRNLVVVVKKNVRWCMLRWVYTVSVFRTFSSVFLHFCFLTKYALFHPHFYVSISALTRQSHTGQKFSEKNFL